ncbi:MULTISPECIES: hypothetical protein [unclassified Bradyrhizobium]|uniref:hypothetical protein n=1 Tax=unclassified Bradyrhizobium TaxID=2631580 RepID=UPI002479B2CE|nr:MULTISPECIES: hypothetical protein [unclassified Bradyrhizobium]WGR73896.1 hypothetical protein MTX24_14240 [Bradyrhizobium sp. ISRA426]WGR78733.1 hypothetical protein MTX21_39210 [Bradyrhizobium sp. ISRA430]WGR89135.1 hypothetical protein MTX25_14255 [Bradyrhizobium sp. ISRA432]
MTSKRQIEANRANAKKSSGPRTAAGKARASRNARRHGLSRWVENASRSNALAELIVAELDGPNGELAAQHLAQAKLRLFDIQHARCRLLAALMECPGPQQLKDLAGLERYEKIARARQRRGLKHLDGVKM